MNKLIATVALVCAFAASPAQLVQSDTPEIGTVYSYARTASGSAYLLSSLPVHEAYFALPFGLDFNAGWGGVYGQRVEGAQFAGNVFGAELYGRKKLGASGAFVKGSLYFVIGDGQDPDGGFALALGWEF